MNLTVSESSGWVLFFAPGRVPFSHVLSLLEQPLMCGRYSLSSELHELIAEFVADGGRAEDWLPTFSIAPTNRVPIVRQWRDSESEDINRELTIATWGFRPAWAKGSGRPPINARIETVSTNRLFRGSFTSQRCLVPMSPGYYEWKDLEDGKQPFLIHGDGILAAAGIYTSQLVDDEWEQTFTIITTDAMDRAGDIHDRSPVFITPDLWDQWLDPTPLNDPKKTDPDRREATLDMLHQTSAAVAATLDSHPVSRQLNNVRTAAKNDPATAAPIEIPA